MSGWPAPAGAVDSAHQVVVAADECGSGSKQGMLRPMVEQSLVVADAQTLFTADSGYHSDDNEAYLCERDIPALIANKGLNRFHLRGEAKVLGQWHLFCLVHNIEKLARAGIGQAAKTGI